MNREQVTAVIIAGGKGRRFQGEDKGLILFHGRTIVARIVEQLSEQIPSIVINANRNLAQYRQFNVPVIADELSDYQGPLAGILMAMQWAQIEKQRHIIVLPCDAPFVCPHYVQRMMQALARDRLADIAVAFDGDRSQPLHAMITVSLQDNLKDYIKSGGRKVGHWYSQQKMVLVDFSDSAEMFQNINSADELTMLENQGWIDKD